MDMNYYADLTQLKHLKIEYEDEIAVVQLDQENSKVRMNSNQLFSSMKFMIILGEYFISRNDE